MKSFLPPDYVPWDEQCRRAAAALPRETRQRYLDLIREGKTIGDAQRLCEISFEAANGIVMQNIASANFLRREAL